MNTSTTPNARGFTIIEVVLVLAIAGLIFLLVFLAVPALQRSQRDTQRRSDMGRVVSQLQSSQSNNKGKVPINQAELNTFKSGYLTVAGDTFADPTYGDYALTYQANRGVNPTNQTIYYYPSSKCNGEKVEASGSRSVALKMDLEGGGYYCQNN